MKREVWILMSVANEYNQPESAFEKLFWKKPTYEDLKEYGFTRKEAKNMRKPNRDGDGEYWVAFFTDENNGK